MLSGHMKSRTPAAMLCLHSIIHSFSTCVLNTCTISGASVGIRNKAQSKTYSPQDAVTVVEEYETKLIGNHKIYRILNLPPSLIFLSVQFSGIQYIHNHHHYLFPKHFYDLKLCTHYALIPLSPQSLEASNIFSVHTHLSIPYTSQKTNHTISICLFVSGVFHLACFKVHSCYSRY